MAVLGSCREFFRLPQSAAGHASQRFGGLDTELAFNNPDVVRHVAQLAEWQATKVFDYSGKGQSAEPRFQKGEGAIFVGSSGTRADIKANSKFEVGYGMIPYRPEITGAPQNSIIGGATLWVLRDRPRTEYAGVAKFFAYLSKPEVQAAWHQNTGYLPITRAAFDLSRAQGFYDRNPGAAIGIEQLTLKPPTENSKGIRLGSFVLIRGVIDEELEHVFSGKQSAQAALDAAVERGNRLLRQFILKMFPAISSRPIHLRTKHAGAASREASYCNPRNRRRRRARRVAISRHHAAVGRVWARMRGRPCRKPDKERRPGRDRRDHCAGAARPGRAARADRAGLGRVHARTDRGMPRTARAFRIAAEISGWGR